MAARTNKYTSINFNTILEKTSSSINNNNNNNKSKQPINNKNPNFNNVTTRTEGSMLVLTRPSSKPITKITPPQQPDHKKPVAESEDASSDSISLRPRGTTGPTGLGFGPVQGLEKDALIGSKSNKFVPPHLRPGFVGREEKFGPDVSNVKGHVRVGDEERPKSGGGGGGGGGYDRRMRMLGGVGGVSDRGLLGTPRSTGNGYGYRPSSSGCGGYWSFTSSSLTMSCGSTIELFRGEICMNGMVVYVVCNECTGVIGVRILCVNVVFELFTSMWP
ncbi:hypothetical protein ACFE04_018616 [Oxalis oulophora]